MAGILARVLRGTATARPAAFIAPRMLSSTTISARSTATDKILMKGMVFHGYHGVFGAEKELGQKFVVDVEVRTDLSVSGQTPAASPLQRALPCVCCTSSAARLPRRCRSP
jgi:hypothetical protein